MEALLNRLINSCLVGFDVNNKSILDISFVLFISSDNDGLNVLVFINHSLRSCLKAIAVALAEYMEIFMNNILLPLDNS
jgi:hypothetical protein